MPLRILRYSRTGVDHRPDALTAEEWRRWAARVFAEAVAEQGTPILDGVPKSRARAQEAGAIELWDLCRRGFLRARARVKRCALVLAHTAMLRAEGEAPEYSRARTGGRVDDQLFHRLAVQYRGIYQSIPGDDPDDDDDQLRDVVHFLAASEEIAARSLNREDDLD